MSSFEEQTYSTIFTSLKHPIRRKIIRMLSERPRSFSEIQEVFRIESPHLTYHLESLGSLLCKTENGKYALSALGDAAKSMMYQVEEAPKTPPRLPSLSIKWKAFFATLMVGLILTASLSYVQYQTISQLSAEHAKIREEYEQLLNILENLGPEKAILTYEYTVNGSVARAAPDGVLFFLYNIWFIYSLKSNSRLEMEVFFPTPLPPEAYLSISVSWIRKEIWTPPGQFALRIGGGWSINVTDSGTYSAPLPSTGWYSIWVNGPSLIILRIPTEKYAINYTMTLKVKSQSNYVPFFVGSTFP